MKTFALIALIGSASAYAVSEGPTKVDFGEADDNVLPREFDTKNGGKFHGWSNPLGWTDGGADDESVLLQRKNHEENVSVYDAEPVMKLHDYSNVQNQGKVNLRSLRNKGDMYDNDVHTVSQYDDMPIH